MLVVAIENEFIKEIANLVNEKTLSEDCLKFIS